MKKWTGGVVILGLALLLIVSYSFTARKSHVSPKKQSAYEFFNPHSPPQDSSSSTIDANPVDKLHVWNKEKPQFRNLEGLSDLYSLSENITRQDSNVALLVWSRMRYLFPRSDALPQTAEGVKEAATLWKDLLLVVEKDKILKLDVAFVSESCPYFVSARDTELSSNVSFLEVPCGLVDESSVTVIGIPNSLQDGFEIDLMGSQVKDETEPPIVLQYNVYLPGKNLTKEPVIIQNTWTSDSGWGKEQKCPDHGPAGLLKGSIYLDVFIDMHLSDFGNFTTLVFCNILFTNFQQCASGYLT